jgi:hypothetical protein
MVSAGAVVEPDGLPVGPQAASAGKTKKTASRSNRYFFINFIVTQTYVLFYLSKQSNEIFKEF